MCSIPLGASKRRLERKNTLEMNLWKSSNGTQLAELCQLHS
jgi:hypothetical protein